MMALLAELLGPGPVNWRQIAKVTGGVAVAGLLVFLVTALADLGRERTITQRMLAAIRNPTVVRKTVTHLVKGPVVTKTVVVETAGRKETVTTEERGAEESWNNAEETWKAPTPAQLAGLEGHSLSGWEVGPSFMFGPEPLRDRLGLVTGYTFSGRVTLCGLVGMRRVGALGLWRFN